MQRTTLFSYITGFFIAVLVSLPSAQAAPLQNSRHSTVTGLTATQLIAFDFDAFFARLGMRSSSSTNSSSSSSTSVSSSRSSSSLSVSSPSSSSSSSSSSISSSTSSTNSSSSVNSTLASIRARILVLVNEERAKAGLSALKAESHLDTAAQLHAQDMVTRNFFSHTNPDGDSPTTRIRRAGYPLNGSWSTGENIAKGQKTAEIVMQTWMNSAGHKANILSSRFQDIGIGFVNNVWVQNFASHSR